MGETRYVETVTTHTSDSYSPHSLTHLREEARVLHHQLLRVLIRRQNLERLRHVPIRREHELEVRPHLKVCAPVVPRSSGGARGAHGGDVIFHHPRDEFVEPELSAVILVIGVEQFLCKEKRRRGEGAETGRGGTGKRMEN